MTFAQHLREVRANGRPEKVDEIVDAVFVPDRPGERAIQRVQQLQSHRVPSLQQLRRWEDG